MVLFFSDLNKAQIYKMLQRDSPHQQTEILMSFKYLSLFKPEEHKQDFLNRGQNDKNFLFEFENNNNIQVAKNVFTIEMSDKVVKNSSTDGFTDKNYSYAYGGEKIYLMLQVFKQKTLIFKN